MKSHCEVCKWRSRAERKPNSLISKLWRWHTKWCPGWKAYQEELCLDCEIEDKIRELAAMMTKEP